TRGDPGTRRLGARGESIAARYLRRKGYRIVGRNLRTEFGEIDLLVFAPAAVPRGQADASVVARAASWARASVGMSRGVRPVVVVEVKTRIGDTVSGGVDAGQRAPEAAITSAKAQRLRKLLGYICRANGWDDRPKRVDVVAISVPHTAGTPEIRHYESIDR
ncbi:MAG: YraN family protein, partial [Planctomycetota bacterium]